MNLDSHPVFSETTASGAPAPAVRPWLAHLPRVTAVISAVLPASGLLGWMLDIPLLREMVSGGKPLNPLAALALLMASVALALAATQRGVMRKVSRALGWMVAMIGTARVLDFALGNPLRVDLVLFREWMSRYSGDPQMTPVAAGCFALVGLTLALYRGAGSRGRQVSRYALVPVAMLAFYVVCGSAYGGQVFMSVAQFRPMALNAATCCLFLTAGLAALPPAVPPISTLAMESSGGSTARSLLPAVLIIPFLLGWLRVVGERAQWFDMGFGTAALTTVTALLLVLLVLLSVRYLNRTEKAQHELALGLRASERRLFQILEAIPIGIFVRDREGKPYYSNRAGQEISGMKAIPTLESDQLSQAYKVYRAGTDQLYPAGELPGARALRGEKVYLNDIEIHRPDRVAPVEVWACPVTNDLGEIEFSISAYNDITVRQESERKIEALNDDLKHQVAELDAVNQELETFSYSVSHDLRAPLRAVDGFSRMLTEDHAATLSPEALRLLDRIRSNIRRMGLLIDDLLRFSRLSRKELETAPVDMKTLARAVMDDLARSREHQVRITCGDLPRAQGDVELLRQVWINLIDNALKYSGKQGNPTLEIGGSRNADEATYWVRDNGVGFDMAFAGKLFGVFQRLHSQDEFEGTGVGLAIVQRIVHRHGGRVWAEGAPDRGATFSFTLPLGGVHAGH